ncbi:MAG TPA: hypothetical protein PK095_19125, partial [Myxococcota bacterium]|nr:hypothetical protein [Myxococcota bacterium]
ELRPEPTSALTDRPASQVLAAVERLDNHVDRLRLPPRFAKAALERYVQRLDPLARVIYGPAEHIELGVTLLATEWALEVGYVMLPHLGLGVTSRSSSKRPRALLVYDRDTLFVRRPYTAYLLRALEKVKPEELDADGRPMPWIPLAPSRPDGRQQHRDRELLERDGLGAPDAEIVGDLEALAPEPAPTTRTTSAPGAPGAPGATGILDDQTILRWHETLCRAAGLDYVPELQLVRGEVHQHGFCAGRVWFTRDGIVRRIKLTTCPNADLAEVLATLCHELAHPLARSSHHDAAMKGALIALCQRQFGARFFAHVASIAGSERMSLVDAWVALGIRQALKGGDPPAPKAVDDGQMAKILGRIRKLRQLAKDQRGLPEGVLATSSANDLATLHGLAYQGLDVQTADDLDDDKVVDRFVVLPDGAVWRRLLAHDVAGYFDVFALSLPGAGRMHFFGAHADVVGAEYLFSVSARRIERECEAHVKAWKARRGKTTSAETRKEKTSFCDSAAIAFGRKLKGYREDPEGSTLSSRAFGERLERAEEVARQEHAKRGSGWSSSGTKTYRENEAGKAVGASMEVLHGVGGEPSARLTRKG